MSAILSADLVAGAFAAIRPSLQAAIDSGLVTRPDVAVVVAATSPCGHGRRRLMVSRKAVT